MHSWILSTNRHLVAGFDHECQCPTRSRELSHGPQGSWALHQWWLSSALDMKISSTKFPWLTPSHRYLEMPAKDAQVLECHQHFLWLSAITIDYKLMQASERAKSCFLLCSHHWLCHKTGSEVLHKLSDAPQEPCYQEVLLTQECRPTPCKQWNFKSHQSMPEIIRWQTWFWLWRHHPCNTNAEGRQPHWLWWRHWDVQGTLWPLEGQGSATSGLERQSAHLRLDRRTGQNLVC